jgi:nitrite reductase/ring-hydroxylating ferredoxin subunit
LCSGKNKKNMKLTSCLKAILIFFVLHISTSSCDDVQESEVPDIPFTFSINLVIDNELTIPGNSKYYPYGGFGGVIVVCETPGTYYAYDAACTHEISRDCKVVNTGIQGVCKCCKAEYVLLYTAYPVKGPAVAPLRQYNVVEINNSMLRVYNN